MASEQAFGIPPAAPLALLAAVLATCSPGPGWAGPKADSALEGNWNIVFYVQDYDRKGKSDGGMAVPITTTMTLMIKGKAFEIRSGGDSATWRIERVASADGKAFEIDLADAAGKVRAKSSAKLDGDVLHVKIPFAGGDRTKDLTLKPGEAGILIGARRAKE